MPAHQTTTSPLLIAAFMLMTAQQVHAAGDPTGVWMNDTGRGAVEIKPCGAALCGHVVWVQDTTDSKGCGRQIIGNAAKVDTNTWDNGWIYSPEKKKKYDVELKPLANDTLQVTGYAGTKLFSKTMIWKRAPADLVRCGAEETVAKADPALKPDVKAKPEAKIKPEAKAEAKAKPEAKTTAKPTATAKSEPALVPPAPKPAERPATKPASKPVPESVEVARADPDTIQAPSDKPETTPGALSSTKQLPQDHALPGVANERDAPEVAAPREDEAEDQPKLDMGNIAKKLAQIERETGYGLKKTGNGNCRLKVPYATVNFPCKN